MVIQMVVAIPKVKYIFEWKINQKQYSLNMLRDTLFNLYSCLVTIVNLDIVANKIKSMN